MLKLSSNSDVCFHVFVFIDCNPHVSTLMQNNYLVNTIEKAFYINASYLFDYKHLDRHRYRHISVLSRIQTNKLFLFIPILFVYSYATLTMMYARTHIHICNQMIFTNTHARFFQNQPFYSYTHHIHTCACLCLCLCVCVRASMHPTLFNKISGFSPTLFI